MADELRSSTSTASTSRSDSCNEEVTVRQATLEDHQDIVELSNCTHDQHDWLPTSFLKILQKENSHIFLALVEGRLAGCVLCSVVDSDITLVMWGMRIHPLYRRRHISDQLREAVLNLAKERYTSIQCERFTAITENNHVMRLRQKLGFKKVLELKALSVFIGEDVRKLLSRVLLSTMPEYSVLTRFNHEDASSFISVQKRNNRHMPTQTVIMEHIPYELTPSNAHLLFEENDCIFVDKDLTRPSRVDRLRNLVPGLKPRSISSFSQGRAVPRVQCNHWEAVLYTYKPDCFKNHMLHQLKAALKATTGKLVFTCFHSKYNSAVAWELLVQELCLRQLDDKQAISKLVVYERPFITNRLVDSLELEL